jgi:hypothetical protein
MIDLDLEVVCGGEEFAQGGLRFECCQFSGKGFGQNDAAIRVVDFKILGDLRNLKPLSRSIYQSYVRRGDHVLYELDEVSRRYSGLSFWQPWTTRKGSRDRWSLL